MAGTVGEEVEQGSAIDLGLAARAERWGQESCLKSTVHGAVRLRKAQTDCFGKLSVGPLGLLTGRQLEAREKVLGL